MTRIVIRSAAAALLAIAACQSDKVSSTRKEPMTQTPITAPANGDLAMLGVSIDDAAGRIAPALEDPAAAVDVSVSLRRLSDAMTTGDAAGARAALAAARAALGRSADTPDGAAIGLVLDRADAFLSARGQDPGAQSRVVAQPGVGAPR